MHQTITTYAKIIRISIGFIFLWAFFDKLFGLGFATETGKAWINGFSPTTGFLLNATHGPFVSFFQLLAHSNLIDMLFMCGLFGVGISLIFQVYIRFGVWSATAMLFLMYLAALPPTHNPLIDEHLIYIMTLHLVYHVEKTLSKQKI